MVNNINLLGTLTSVIGSRWKLNFWQIMTPPIPGGFLINTKFAMENKVHYLVFRVQAVPRKIFGNRRMTVLLLFSMCFQKKKHLEYTNSYK